MGSVPVTVDGACHNAPDSSYSIRATNVSAIIGGIVSGIIFLIIVIVVLVRQFGCCGRPCACCGKPPATAPPPAMLVVAPAGYPLQPGQPGQVYAQQAYAQPGYPAQAAYQGQQPAYYPPPGAQQPGTQTVVIKST